MTEEVLVNGQLVPNEWPFRIDLLPRTALFADDRYQRPPNQVFVQKLVEEFDPTLVATLDVSVRSDGRYAILDGLQRHSAMEKMQMEYVWCAVYEGMDVAAEANFFYRRNKNRRTVHPYYQFRAMLVMGDADARQIDKIVKREKFKLNINAGPENHISAVRAVESAYGYSSLARKESLTPTLRVIRKSMLGRKGAKDGEMIRGLARFLQPFYDQEIDWQHLEDLLADVGPMNLLGRVKDKASGTGHGKSGGYVMAREILTLYNRGVARGHKLPERMLERSATRARKKQEKEQPV